MAYLTSKQGVKILVDDDMYETLSPFTWIIHNRGRVTKRLYAIRFDENQKYTQMHHDVVGKKKGKVVDHINGNSLDNRRENLRHCTQQENCLNKAISSKNTSGVKGVYWEKSRKKWVARIFLQGKQTFIGRFDRLENAKKAYNKEAKKLHKEFSKLN